MTIARTVCTAASLVALLLTACAQRDAHQGDPHQGDTQATAWPDGFITSPPGERIVMVIGSDPRDPDAGRGR